MRIQCIYKITNKSNDMIYIGSSSNLLSRWNAHLECLIKGKHNNPLLQNDFNKYGITEFMFEIIEYFYNPIERYELLKIETKYILKYNATDPNIGYNINIPTRYKEDSKGKKKTIECGISQHDISCILKNSTVHILKEKHFIDKKDMIRSYNHNWFLVEENKIKAKKQLYNYFFHIVKSNSNEVCWNTYIDIKDSIKGKGNIKGYRNDSMEINEKRNKLAFMMNPQINPFTKDIYDDIDKENYGINIMFRWIKHVSDITKPIDILIPNPILADKFLKMKYEYENIYIKV